MFNSLNLVNIYLNKDEEIICDESQFPLLSFLFKEELYEKTLFYLFPKDICGELLKFYEIFFRNSFSKHAFRQNKNQEIWSFGQNKFFDENITSVFSPSLFNFSLPLRQIEAGFNFTLFLSTSNSIYIFGSNSESNDNFGLSFGEDVNLIKEPQKILFPDQKIQEVDFISCGKFHVFAKMKTKFNEKQIIYGWGDNRYEQIKINDSKINKFTKPILVEFDFPIKQIKSSLFSTIILSTDETKIQSFGMENFLFDFKLQFHEKQKPEVFFIGSDRFFVIMNEKNRKNNKTNLNLYGYGNNFFGQLGIKRDGNNKYYKELALVPFEKSNKIKNILCSSEQTFILTFDREVYSCGLNNEGKLGYVSNEKSVDCFKKIIFNSIEKKEKEIHDIEVTYSGIFAITKKTKENERKLFTWGNDIQNYFQIVGYNNRFNFVPVEWKKETHDDFFMNRIEKVFSNSFSNHTFFLINKK